MKQANFGHFLPTFFTTLLLISLAGCQSLPQNPHLSTPIEPQKPFTRLLSTPTLPKPLKKPTQTLRELINQQTANHPQLSGYLPILTGANAFAARSILADLASERIDAQYYIWHDDEAGQLMLKDLWEAAQRGVQVRLLLDDMNGNQNLDRLLSHFASHPNIAVRVVNPLLYRNARPINYLVNPIRINRRMHNKSMTYDNSISIIGGRNIGDEYLNNSQNSHFADLDVLLIGKVVEQVNDSFEEYWQSKMAFDIETLTPYQHGNLNAQSHTFIRNDNAAKQNANKKQQALKTYRTALANATIGQGLLNQKLPFKFADIHFMSDTADKLTGGNPDDYLISQLKVAFGTPQKQLSIISSYFVPTKSGVDELIAIAKSGVQVQILTNSYDATDVGMVHSGYAHWRKTLLRAGIRLYEFKATAQHPTLNQNLYHKKDNRLWRTKQHTTTSLHAKVFAVDDSRSFIGSYNLDPRSARYNTEMGVLIDDNELAHNIHTAFDNRLLNQAYEVKLNGEQLEWHTLENGQKHILKREPNMRIIDKFGIGILSVLPIEGLL